MVNSVDVLLAENFFRCNQLKVIISCEHGGYEVPALYKPIFSKAGSLLLSHQGYDPGALELTRKIAGFCKVPFFFSTVTRLLIDLNRSSTSRNLFSSITKNLITAEKKQIIDLYYKPYRSNIELQIKDFIDKGTTVIHFSVHSFTPVLYGKARDADIGLLYNPICLFEKYFCIGFIRNFNNSRPQLKARRNYPYSGKADGLTTFLRKRFAPTEYLGIEIEINQKFPLGSRSNWNRFQNTFIEVLGRTLRSYKNWKHIKDIDKCTDYS